MEPQVLIEAMSDKMETFEKIIPILLENSNRFKVDLKFLKNIAILTALGVGIKLILDLKKRRDTKEE